ncbi:MAG: transglutaminase family protein [Polyangiales bacterium]
MNRILLGVALALSIGACARSLHAPAAWVFALFAIAAPIASFRPGPRLATTIAFFAWLALIATAVVTWSLVVVLMIHGDSTELTLRILGAVLAVLAIGLVLAHRDGFALVMVVALFDLAGVHRREEIRPFVIGAAFVVLAHLARAQQRRRLLAIGGAIGLAASIAAALPPLQSVFERAAFAAFAPKSARSGLSGDDARLGEVESLAVSDRLVLRVWADRAERLRARVYLKFDGRIWHVTRSDGGSVKTLDAPLGPRASSALSFPGPLHALESTDPGKLAGDDIRATRIVPVDLDEGLLPSPGSLLAVKTPFTPMIDAFGVLLPLGRPNDPWVALHRDRPEIADDRVPDKMTLAIATSLPRTVDPRLAAVAAELGTGTAEERIRRTTEWVRNAAHYDLNVGAFKTRDPIAEFLFEKKRGYCEYFASSLAVLLRLEGVPTRFVTGFNVGSDNKVGEHYEVHDADAHAWVEAYVEGRGWLVADPTPAADYLALHPRSISRADAVRAWLADVWLSLRHGGRKGVLKALGYVAFAALLAAGVVVVIRELRRRKDSGDAEKQGQRASLPKTIADCVAALDRAFATLGHPRPPAAGLLEHTEALEALEADTSRTLREAVELVHRCAFAGEPVDDAAVARVTRSVAALRRPEVR